MSTTYAPWDQLPLRSTRHLKDQVSRRLRAHAENGALVGKTTWLMLKAPEPMSSARLLGILNG